MDSLEGLREEIVKLKAELRLAQDRAEESDRRAVEYASIADFADFEHKRDRLERVEREACERAEQAEKERDEALRRLSVAHLTAHRNMGGALTVPCDGGESNA